MFYLLEIVWKKFYEDIFGFFLFDFEFFKKLLGLILNVTEVPTEHQKWPKIIKNIVKTSFLEQRAKKPWMKAEALRKS